MNSEDHSHPPRPTQHPGQVSPATGLLKENVLFLLGLAGMMWGLEVINYFLFGYLDNFGIRPRNLFGLPGIVTAPFVHLNFRHLFSNTFPFLILGFLVLLAGRKVFVQVSVFVILTGGFALWLFGPTGTNHIGSSLLIFGYLGFLLARGIFEKSGFWLAISFTILILYGGMLFGVLPGQPGISWQGHLLGFMSGILAARILFLKTTPVY